MTLWIPLIKCTGAKDLHIWPEKKVELYFIIDLVSTLKIPQKPNKILHTCNFNINFLNLLNGFILLFTDKQLGMPLAMHSPMTLRKRVPIFQPDTPSPYAPESQTPQKRGTPQTPTSHIS